MSKRPTLKDVALHAGVSYQTVSKVLRGQIQVTQETKARIESAVKELGYQPNISARSLRTRSSQLIGYSWHPAIHHHVNPVLEQFLQSIVSTAETFDYHVMLFPLRSHVDLVGSYLDLITTNRVDGFILSDLNYDDARVSVLQEHEFPFVAFGRSNLDWNFPYVDVDGRAGLRMATNHLIEQGHQHIAMLGWQERYRSGTARLNGYLEAMKSAGIEVDTDYVRTGEGNFEFGYQATSQLLKLPKNRRPTAVVAMMDEIAAGALRSAQESGLVIGREFGITGFDDAPCIRYLKPGVTSLRQPVINVGKMVIEMLISLLKGEELLQQQILVEPELIVRDSSLGFRRG